MAKRVRVKIEIEIDCSERDLLKVGGWRNVLRAGREFGQQVADHAITEITVGSLDAVELVFQHGVTEAR